MTHPDQSAWLAEHERLAERLAVSDERATHFKLDAADKEQMKRSRKAALLSHAAAMPQETPALTDERIDQLWDELDGRSIIQGETSLNWNRALRRAFAHAIESALRVQPSAPATPDGVKTPDGEQG